MPKLKRLAKVTRPTLNQIYLRKRLFTCIDQAREAAIVWLHAPPGSGKTTAINSYIEARGLPHIWYQVDNGDKDVASFFYYLAKAACDFNPALKASLPTMDMRELSRIECFSRNFFRELFSGFSERGVIVLDDFHEAPCDCLLQSVLQFAVQETPPQVQIVCVSREAPASKLAKFRVNGTLRCVTWDDLKLTHDECQGIRALYKESVPISGAKMKNFLQRTQGWVAGLVLLLQQGSDCELATEEGDKAAVFDYFAGEIFDKESPEVQAVLLITSVLGQFTPAMANAICANQKAGDIIEVFYARNYFVTQRSAGKDRAYAFHPMFKEFLLNRLAKVRVPTEVERIKIEASKALNHAGDLHAAAVHLMEVQAWEALESHILQHAEALLAQGRHVTTHSWIAALPEEKLSRNPWLRYYLGVSLRPFDADRSIADFKKTYAVFIANKQYEGAYLTWAMAVETIIYGNVNMAPIDFWIAQLDPLVASAPTFPTQELEARVIGCIFSANIWRRFDDVQAVNRWAERAEKLLDTPVNAQYRVPVGTALSAYYGRWVGNLSKCRAIAQRTRLIVENADLPPPMRLMWYVVESMSFWMTGKTEQAFQTIEEGVKVLESGGVTILSSRLKAQFVYAALAKGDHEQCHQLLADASELYNGGQEVSITHYHFLTACLALEEERAHFAKEHIVLAFESVDPFDVPLRLGFINLVRAQCLFESGNAEAAMGALVLTEQWAEKIDNAHILFQCQLTRAQWLMDEHKQGDAKLLLAQALAYGNEHNFVTHPWWGWRRRAVLRIYSFALENDIEPQYVKSLIRINDIVPGDSDFVGEHWPWPLKITTLGQFAILIQDEPADKSRKLQRKSMELLKYIVRYGARDVRADILVDDLWPDAEGDAAHHALETTLYRLRRSLGNHAVVQMNHGRLSLNPSFAWVDILVLEKKLKKIEDAIAAKDGVAIKTMCQELLRLCAGDCLMAHNSSFVNSRVYDNLQQRVLSTLTAAGEYFEGLPAWRDASELYQNAILMSPLTERFYARLMHCQLALATNSEAIVTYQRCQRILLSELGVSPSKDAERLYRKALQ